MRKPVNSRNSNRAPLTPRRAAPQRRFDRLRSLSYADTHVVMVCFSVRFFSRPCLSLSGEERHRLTKTLRAQVERPESLENVEAKWIPDVHYYCAGVKIILVGAPSLPLRSSRC